MRAKILPFELRRQAPDDEMLEVARKADVSLFMDATEVPEQASQVTTRFPDLKQWYLENLVSEIGSGRRLSWEIRQGERAILIGAEPDLKVLRPALLKSAGVRLAGPQLQRERLGARLVEYLRRDRAWSAQDPNWKKDIRVADLPEGLRAEVVALIQPKARDILTPRLLGTLGDEAWQQASLSLASGSIFSKPGTILLLATPLGGKLVADWPQPARAREEAKAGGAP